MHQGVHLQGGQTLFNQGDAANGLYVLTLGSVSIVGGSGSDRRRLVSLSPGMMLGESGWLEGGTRSAQARGRPSVAAGSASTGSTSPAATSSSGNTGRGRCCHSTVCNAGVATPGAPTSMICSGVNRWSKPARK